MRINLILISFAIGIISCTDQIRTDNQADTNFPPINSISLQILGVAQDAGFPQVDCEKDCCKHAWLNPDLQGKVVCIGLFDPWAGKSFLFEATPDFPRQWQSMKTSLPGTELSGIFLTHAHIGHYTGLMYLGHESMGAKEVPVYAMPRMETFLRTNGPWDQLVSFNNISLRSLVADSLVAISDSLFIKALQVPHRDEYSETVGYMIYGPRKKAFFLPDIDKWSRWDTDIQTVIQEVDYAFLDATFFDGEEMPGRDISQIPHPFVEESIKLFQGMPMKDKNKIHFIHFNHTNPLLNPDSPQAKEVERLGFKVAREGLRVEL